MRLELLDRNSRTSVGILDLDEIRGVCSFVSGPPRLEQLVQTTLSKGVYRLASHREGDDFYSFTKRVDAEDPQLHEDLFMELAGGGFYAPQLEALIREARRKRQWKAAQDANAT